MATNNVIINLGPVGSGITSETVSISGYTGTGGTGTVSSLFSLQSVSSFPITQSIDDTIQSLYIVVDSGPCSGANQTFDISGVTPTPTLTTSQDAVVPTNTPTPTITSTSTSTPTPTLTVTLPIDNILLDYGPGGFANQTWYALITPDSYGTSAEVSVTSDVFGSYPYTGSTYMEITGTTNFSVSVKKTTNGGNIQDILSVIVYVNEIQQGSAYTETLDNTTPSKYSTYQTTHFSISVSPGDVIKVLITEG